MTPVIYNEHISRITNSTVISKKQTPTKSRISFKTYKVNQYKQGNINLIQGAPGLR